MIHAGTMEPAASSAVRTAGGKPPPGSARARWVAALPDHRRAVFAILDLLTEEDPEGWAAARFVWMRRLTIRETAMAAWSLLRSLPREERLMVADHADAVPEGGTGRPIPPLDDAMDEAALWADWADPDERLAYLLAIFNRLSAGERAAFLTYAEGGRQ